jgi:peptide deformylase
MEIITNIDELNAIGRCKEVDLQKGLKEAREVISNLKKTLRKNDNIVALSAPALGYDKRIFCIDYSDNEIKTYINPVVTNATGMQLSREVCSSLPGKEFIRPRNQVVDIIYQKPTGEIGTKQFKGIAACVIQHEIDHLEGVNLSDIGLEIEEDFDEATDEERQEIIDMYLDSIDLRREELEEEIANNSELKIISERLKFTEALARGDIKLEKQKENE